MYSSDLHKAFSLLPCVYLLVMSIQIQVTVSGIAEKVIMQAVDEKQNSRYRVIKKLYIVRTEEGHN